VYIVYNRHIIESTRLSSLCKMPTRAPSLPLAHQIGLLTPYAEAETQTDASSPTLSGET